MIGAGKKQVRVLPVALLGLPQSGKNALLARLKVLGLPPNRAWVHSNRSSVHSSPLGSRTDRNALSERLLPIHILSPHDLMLLPHISLLPSQLTELCFELP